VLDEEQHVQAAQEHGVDVKKVHGEDRPGLPGQECPPGLLGSRGCGIEPWRARRLDEPTPSEVKQLMSYVKTHVVARRNARGGRSAQEHLVAALRCLYRQAERDGLIAEADNPARKVYTGAPAISLDYPWTHLISGHLGRVATREDVAMHQQYIADIEASSREALASVNPGPIFKHYGENVWAAVRAHLDAITEHAAAPPHREIHRRAGRCRHRDLRGPDTQVVRHRRSPVAVVVARMATAQANGPHQIQVIQPVRPAESSRISRARRTAEERSWV
jgi:hypothetical protein